MPKGQQVHAIPRRKIPAASSGAFIYYSTVFDATNDWIERDAQLTGVSDSKVGLFSCWYKGTTGSSGTRRLLQIASDYVLFGHSSDTAWSFAGYDSSANLMLILQGANAVSLNVWHHVIASWNCATGTRYLYTDGSDDKRTGGTCTDNGGAWSGIDYTRSDCGIGADIGGANKINATLCEFWFNTEYLDISVQSNREKFRTSGGKPENLGSDGSTPTGNQPLIYLRNEYSTFQTNLGSGGGFTENGSLGDGGADIP